MVLFEWYLNVKMLDGWCVVVCNGYLFKCEVVMVIGLVFV